MKEEEPKKKSFVEQSAEIQEQIKEARDRGDHETEEHLQLELNYLADSYFQRKPRSKK